MNNKRNFCIIAHVDHGKSTLSDRLIEFSGVIDPKKMREQFLDNLPVERERGITVRSQTINLPINLDGETYYLNLIDTPGHSDFQYEVSRAMAACEGAVLLVDASQGVQAQTLSYSLLAIENNLEIIVAINKIDLPTADIEKTKRQIEEMIGIPTDDSVLISAKTGEGVKKLIKKIIEKIPPPKYDDSNLSSLIIDSWYDNYVGVISLVRVFSGEIKPGDEVIVYSTKKKYTVQKVGILRGEIVEVPKLTSGDVGVVILGVKDIFELKVGDTITDRSLKYISGFREIKPLVYAGFYPKDPDEYQKLKEAIFKLKLNDYSLEINYENSPALGGGFRIGFLGTLHMDITAQRLKDEFGSDVIITFPQVAYKIELINGEEVLVKSPSDFPPPEKIRRILEPYAIVSIHTPQEFIGSIIKICEEKRGEQVDMMVSGGIAIIKYSMPISSIVFGFNDLIKGTTKGFGSWDWEFEGWKESDIVKLDTYLNGKKVDELSVIISKEEAYRKARELADKLRRIIPRQLFEVTIQVGVGSKILAREDIKPIRKDVTAKCYGGDVTRKIKLLEKQKEGKKKLKMIGEVEVPAEAFTEIFGIKIKSTE